MNKFKIHSGSFLKRLHILFSIVNGIFNLYRPFTELRSILGGTVILLLCSSWGYKGHQTIAYIAQRHLTPKAAQAVKALLGNQSLVNIASWADEVDRQPQWKYTAPWHYVNVGPGLNEQQFNTAVQRSPDANLLKALTKCEAEITNPNVSKEQKIIDLKFIVHLTGDAHQSMHVSHAQDKGGNQIQVRFDGKGTNLHALWDSRLLDKQGLSDAQFADRFDMPADAQIILWQNSSPLNWLYESYTISTKLYAETARNSNFTDAYYNQHIDIADRRIEMAGIRLAGIINRLFKNKSNLTPQRVGTSTVNGTTKLIDITTAPNHYNQMVTISTKVYGYKNVSGMALVDAGGRYPHQLLTIVLKGKARALSTSITNKNVQVSGTLIQYKGKPEIIITDPADFVIK